MARAIAIAIAMFLAGCGGSTPAPRPQMAAPVAPPERNVELEFAQLRTGLEHEPLMVDTSHFADGGMRFVREDGRIVAAPQAFEDNLIAAANIGELWYFLTQHENASTLWIASSYLGSARAVRQFLGRASLAGGEEPAVIDGEARLHRLIGNEWSVVSALDDYAIVDARSIGGRFFALERGARWLENSSHLSWTTSSPPSPPSPPNDLERPRGDVDIHIFNAFIARYPREGFTHSALKYLGQGRFADVRSLISREGVQTLPFDTVLGSNGARDVSYRTSLLGGLIVRTENVLGGNGQWWFMDAEQANYRRLEFPLPAQAVQGNTPLENVHTEYGTLLWECQQDLVCWIRPEEGAQTQIPVMGFRNAAVSGMRGGHLYLVANTGRIDMVDLTTGHRRPLPLPDDALANRIWFIDSGFIATPEGADFAFRYHRADDSFERLTLPFPGVVMSMATGRVIVLDDETRHAISTDGGATWQDLRIRGSRLGDDYCYLDACVIGNTVISEVGTFPPA